MKSFKFNGKTVTPRALTFNAICELEDMGYDITALGDKTFGFIRVFLGLWTGATVEEAGVEIDEHLAGGGTLDELMDAITEAINESSFFNKAGKKTPATIKMKEATE